MPEQAVSRVGVVSNFSQYNVIVGDEEAVISPLDPDTIKEQIALTFAESGMMERVAILDSSLYRTDDTAPHILSQAEVNDLCQLLEVDMIYSIDYACLSFYPVGDFIARPLTAYLCSRIYTPDTDSVPGTKVLSKKIREYWMDNIDELNGIVPQIPYDLSETAIESYLPSWKERERVFYYDRLCYELREAKVYVEEGNWEAAAMQWRALATSKLRTHRFMAAYNMALYYEMADSIPQALASLDQAQELAMKRNGRKGTPVQVIDTTMVKEYREALISRQKEIVKIEEYLSRMR